MDGSGVACLTAALRPPSGENWAGAAKARVLDTRKTLLRLWSLQKYAVRSSGGVHHRLSLSDMTMVKADPVIAAGVAVAGREAAAKARPEIPVEGEETGLDQLCEPSTRALGACIPRP